MIGVFYILSQALGVVGFALLVPAAIGIVAGDPAGEVFLVIAGLIGFVAGAAFFALRGRRRKIARIHGVATVVIVWVGLPFVAAAPIAWSSSAGYLGALFEASSGLTTTGATVFAALSEVGPAVLFWRAELQWLGGLFTLLTFTAILAPLGIGGLSARGLVVVGRQTGDLGRTIHLLRDVVVVYALGTGACAGLLFTVGLPAFDAFSLALSTVSTGGFMPRDGGLSVYANAPANAIVAIFMLIGATSIVWHRVVIDRRSAKLSEHIDSYWVIIMAVIVGLGYAAVLLEPASTLLTAIGEGLFTGISLITTTGVEVHSGSLAALPGSLVLFFAVAGGAALSTAGGLKLYRLGAMLVQSTGELHRLVFPNSVRGEARFGGMSYDAGAMRAIWANLAISAIVVLVAAVVLSLQLPTIDSALIAAVAAFSNIGPLYAAEWPVDEIWPHFVEFDGLSKSVMIVTMILGRIEVFVFVAMFSIADWRM